MRSGKFGEERIHGDNDGFDFAVLVLLCYFCERFHDADDGKFLVFVVLVSFVRHDFLSATVCFMIPDQGFHSETRDNRFIFPFHSLFATPRFFGFFWKDRFS